MGVTRKLEDRTFERFVEEQGKNARLANLLKSLAENGIEDEETLDGAMGVLKSLYLNPDGTRNEFRHEYSTIARVMCEVASASPEQVDDVSAGMSKQNYYGIRANKLADCMNFIAILTMNDKSLSEMVKPVMKIRDHVNLEMVRINYVATVNGDQEGAVERIRQGVTKSYDKVVELSDSVEASKDEVRNLKVTSQSILSRVLKAEDEIDKSKKDSVTILGVLAAVVLAFNGGITFSVSGVNAVSGYHPIYVAFVVSLVGFVLFNALAVLFTFLRASVIERKTEDGKRCAIWGTGPLIAFVIADVALVLFVCKLFRIVYESYLF